MTTKAQLSDCMAAMATLAAMYPGRFPVETQQAWARKLHQDGCAVEDLVRAVDLLPERSKRPVYVELWGCVMDARDDRHRREAYRPPSRQLARGEERPLTGEPAERACLAAKVMASETRQRIQRGDHEPIDDDRFYELRDLPIDQLRRLAEEADRLMERLDQSAKGRRALRPSAVAREILGGNTPPGRPPTPASPPDSSEPDQEGDDLLF